jgi:hypothetical protein
LEGGHVTTHVHVCLEDAPRRSRATFFRTLVRAIFLIKGLLQSRENSHEISVEPRHEILVAVDTFPDPHGTNR